MKLQKAMLGQHWIAIACLGSWGWLGIPLPPVQPAAQAQAHQSQQCIDEVSNHLWGVVVERAQRGHDALQDGQIQAAVDHLAGALEFLGTVEDAGVRARTLETFIQTNSSDTGWLITDVDRLIELGETEAVRRVLAPAQSATQRLPSGYSFLKTRLLAVIAADYAAIGDRELALNLLDQARQAGSTVQGAEFKAKALTAIAQGYVAVGEGAIAVDMATQALQQAELVTYPNPVRRSWVVEPIAMVYADAGAIDRAVQVAQSLGVSYSQGNALGGAVLALVRAGQIDRAMVLLDTISVAEPKIRTLIAIGLQFTDDGDNARATRFFEQAIATVEAEEHLPVDTVPMLIEAGLPGLALDALAFLDNDFFKVNHLIEIARYYTVTGNRETAGAVLSSGIEVVSTIDDNYRRNELFQAMFDEAVAIEQYDRAIAMIEAATEAEQRLSAPETFDEMGAYTRVAVAAAESGQIGVALKATEAIDPNFISYKNQAWAAIAIAYAAAGDFESALATAEAITQGTGQRDLADYVLALAGIGLHYQKAGRLEESAATMTAAIQAAEAIAAPMIRLNALNRIALVYVEANQSDSAGALFDRVLAAALALSTDLDPAFTLQEIATSWSDIGEYEFALRALGAIADQQRQDSALRNWGDRLIEAEEYSQALTVAETHNNPATQTDQMLQIARGYFQAGQIESALLVLARAYEVAQTIPGEESQLVQVRHDLVVDDLLDRGSLYEAIAVAYGKMGAFERGLAVAQSLEESETRDRAIERINCYRNF